MIIKGYFFLFLRKNLCCGCSLELPRCGEAILMSTHNIGFHKEMAKLPFSYHQICTLSIPMTLRILTRNDEKDVINPSFKISDNPPYSSSSTF